MINYTLVHPEILAALASAGHGAQIAICDANFATAVRAPERARVVYLNLAPDLLTVTQILEVVLQTIPVEKVAAMAAPPEIGSEVQDQVRACVGDGVAFELLEKPEFYALVGSELTALLIASADTRRFSNLVLTIGVVK
jgi:L-fucose mutarotase